jgi:uncharacterized delta-60 repeat protein
VIRKPRLRRLLLESLEPRRVLARYGLEAGFNPQTPDFGVGDDATSAMVIAPGDKIVAVGESNYQQGSGSDLSVVRYLPTGIVDFATTIEIAADQDFAGASAVAMDADGKILVAGSVSKVGSADNDFVVLRLNSNGTLDTMFGVGGKRVLSLSPTSDRANQILLQSDGRIVVAGSSSFGNNDQWVTFRLDAEGALDTSYGANGFAQTNLSNEGFRFTDEAVINASDEVTLVGTQFAEPSRKIGLVRFDATGSLNLLQISDFGVPSATVDDMLQQPDGKLVLAAYQPFQSGYRSFLIRLHADGRLDSSFGVHGVTPLVFRPFGLDIELTPANTILLRAESGFETERTLSHYKQDGSVDRSFGIGGEHSLPESTLPGFYREMKFQADGRLALAGSNAGSYALARLNISPSVDLRGADVLYTEDGAPQRIAPLATVTDWDNANLAGGVLTADFEFDPQPDDRLTIRNASPVSISGDTVSVGGIVVGTMSGGDGTAPLQVALNASATPVRVQSIVRQIQYSTVSQAADSERSFQVQLTDGAGGTSDAALVNIIDLPVNDAPVLDNALNPVLKTTLEDAPIPAKTLVSTLLVGAVTDPDPGTPRGIAVTSASSFNGAWQFSFDAGASWQSMGTPSNSAARLLPGNYYVRFVPKLDFNGTVKLFYRAWDKTEGLPGGTFDTADNTGGTKSLSTAAENASLLVKPVNDAPVLNFGGAIDYARDAAAMALAPSAGITDVDSLEFAGGRLRVWVGVGASSSNRLAIGSGFTIDANNNVLSAGTIIGKRASSGFGTSELVVVFNASATKLVVRDLVRAITFKTVGGAAGQRQIRFTVSDGDGGLSAEVSKTVNVV